MNKHDESNLTSVDIYIRQCERVAEHGSLGRIGRDEIYRLALMKAVSDLGEISSVFSQSFRKKHRKIDWESIIDVRNKLVHLVYPISNEILWFFATDFVQELRDYLLSLK
ncbi:MAG: DUF86 domain-containing protein [Candidatus Symbiobacter sp.]|nr:DUF86 domain-containing protein [Candidatus Symbiobacter sp.]